MQTQDLQYQKQQQAGQTTQTRMSEPPQVITGKDLYYIKDALTWELGAVKKINKFAQECQDAQIKAQLQKNAQMHQKHYNSLLKHLQSQ